ncbi:LysR family transcriptional regulator [Ramlibacter sp. AW1]|uniref:LysR family transcriptional regulator n=1 Tax=Ramlibacter aurantiacus TaxID=2801330 RepID=A0A937D841_9BURK|nr:LysR substrate-binding domain-containing protein [Ramlibacter aurantiacus]MBL0422648.1 LysR family transcriptional regulator [Ramlibacter aurantiacus]
MELKDVDLNLLVVFNELLTERRVSAVAAKLGLSQPAVSNILNRLRKLLGDELFLRTSRGMEPTPYALQLSEPIAYALTTIHGALNERTMFDAASSERRFTLGLSDIGEVSFLSRLLERLDALAPHVSVSTLRSRREDLAQAMEAGAVDLAIGTLSQLPAGFFQRRLFLQRYVCMFRQGHALDKGSITQEEYCAAQHLVVLPPGSAHAQVSDFIERRGIKRNVRLTVPNYTPVGYILGSGNSNLVATVPESYAIRCVEPFGLRYVAHPFHVPHTSVNLFWHAKFHRESGNKWLRQVVVDLFSNPEAAGGNEAC